MVKVGVVGGTGYTGVELLRLLALHDEVEVASITSRSEKGLAVADLYPNLRGHYDICFSEPDLDSLAACDLVFFATPNGVAMKMVPELIARGTRVIDLAADFRIKDLQVWEHWYGQQHACPDWVAKAVYGLPEVNRKAIQTAQIVANPGCYPTAVQLGFLPILEKGLVDTDRLIADAKSGASGAGRGAQVHTLLSEAAESFGAYGASGHRHLPEIRQGLNEAHGQEVGLTFVPHLLPMIRGIEATLYAGLKDASISNEALQAIFEERYQEEPFVDVMPFGSHPQTRSVKGSNMCRIALHRQPDNDTLIVLSVIDNLVKGAAGQAVQNLNIMFGLDEMSGLRNVALLP